MLGENIKAIRENQVLSKEQFADIIGIKAKTLENWENNRTKPHLDYIYKIRKELNVSADEIFKGL